MIHEKLIAHVARRAQNVLPQQMVSHSSVFLVGTDTKLVKFLLPHSLIALN